MLSETVRIKMVKRGRLKFISHLDMCRTMQSAMLRAKLPIWYTEGFNPHPRMTFALPLSVGAESECELLDVKLNEIPDLEWLVDSLNRATAPEIEILEAYIPQTKFTEIASAGYEIRFELPYGDNFAALFSGSVVLPKRTKNGDVDTDITSMINKIDFQLENSQVLCRAVLSAGADSYLNPEYIVRAIEKDLNKEQNSFEYYIRRVNIFDKTGNTFR